MNLNRIFRGRLGSLTGLDRLVQESALGLRDALGLGILVAEGVSRRGVLDGCLLGCLGCLLGRGLLLFDAGSLVGLHFRGNFFLGQPALVALESVPDARVERVDIDRYAVGVEPLAQPIGDAVAEPLLAGFQYGFGRALAVCIVLLAASGQK